MEVAFIRKPPFREFDRGNTMRYVNNKKEKAKLLLFLLPALIIYVVFMILPMIGSLYFSFVEWNGIKGAALNFVGMENYVGVFQNPEFIRSLTNMLRMVLLSVLFHTPIALLLAVAINHKFRFYRLFKAIFFVPAILPLTAIGLLWYFIFMPGGSLNSLLSQIGLEHLKTAWLVSKATALNTVIFVNIWIGIGYFMVILLAGLTTIPQELYEAAAIDGVSDTGRFFFITIPLLKPIINVCILMDIIGTIKVFDLIFVMTEGGPNGLTHLPTTLMYFEAFSYDHYGVGSAIGVIILLMALFMTYGGKILLKLSDERKG